MSARAPLGWMLVLAMLASPFAIAAIVSHVDPDTGLTVLSNVAPQRAGLLRSLGNAPARPPKSGAPADFPRISAARQHELEGGRRAILLAELAGEQRALDAAAARRARAEVLHRHQANIAALQRELRAAR